MRVRYLHEQLFDGGGKQCSNIMWEHVGKWPIKEGKFPNEHPVHSFAGELVQFKSKGYWVSPFPEGDGFTMDLLNGQSRETVVSDIRECFGWDVT